MRARTAVDLSVVLPACMALVACHRSKSAESGVVVVDAINFSQPAASPPKTAASRAPTALETPIAAIPANRAGPNPQLSRPAFRDPPLPAELTNDNGLVPLPPPPPPPPSAFQGEHH